MKPTDCAMASTSLSFFVPPSRSYCSAVVVCVATGVPPLEIRMRWVVQVRTDSMSMTMAGEPSTSLRTAIGSSPLVSNRR
jgi:hypothetical protein